MTAAITAIEQTGPGVWRVEWTGTGPFRVYVDGGLVLQGAQAEWTVETGNRYAPPLVEVLDSTETRTPDSLLYSPRVTLQWVAIEGASYYVVEQEVSGAWVQRAAVGADALRTYYTYVGAAQGDQTEQHWRVSAVAQVGVAGVPVEVTFEMVTWPALPEVVVRYDEPTGQVIVEEPA